MNATINMDKAGRIVLPKPVRDELQLAPGDALELELSQERIVLRPARSQGQMKKERGVWVFDAGEAMGHDLPRKVLQQVRKQREARARADR